MILNPSVLIVDDEKNTGEGLERYLLSHEMEAKAVTSAEEALTLLDKQVPDIILTDIKMGSGMDGMRFLDETQKRKLSSTVIMMTAYGTVESAVEAMQKGAYHYLTKPINLDELILVIKKALSRKFLEKENKELKLQIKESLSSNLIKGKSAVFDKLYDEALQVSKSHASVLIEGESGTGKELVARLIHNESDRKEKPFIPVHCGALNPNLMESELFGHEKGAFTGASERKIGRFEKAHGGTIFLDEIGEISQETQVKLLRVLQEGEFERVGGTKTIQVDIRLLAATNKNLSEEVKAGNFREDLFYRINVISLRVPSLRDRKEDIQEIFEYYVKRFSHENNKEIKSVDKKVYDLLKQYAWPGNIRELRNIAERILVLIKKDKIEVSDLPPDIRGEGTSSSQDGVAADGKISDMEREMIHQKLLGTNGNKTIAAKELGISRRTLYRKMQEYGLS